MVTSYDWQQMTTAAQAVPHLLPELLDILALERLDLDLYRGREPDAALQSVFRGQVAAQALFAAGQTVDHDVAVDCMHSYFLRPGDFGPDRVRRKTHPRREVLLDPSSRLPR